MKNINSTVHIKAVHPLKKLKNNVALGNGFYIV